jgi:hypothetical protein
MDASTSLVRSLGECHKILTGPGMPWEMEQKVIKGRKVRVYKQLPPSVRDFWLATKVRPLALPLSFYYS